MHITITTLPGYSRQEKKLLARRLKDAVVSFSGVDSYAISVSVKDLPMEKWDEFIKELSDDEIIIPEACKESTDFSC